MAKKKAPPPTSIFSRTSALFGAATKVAFKEVKSRVGDRARESQLLARIDQAKDIVDALSKLKGAAMKAGQFLSIEGRDFFPPEVLKVLSRLQDSGSSISIESIRKILKKELGPERYAEIKDLSEEPIASASIGQVHRAKIRGRDVALKIQFPGVARSIDSDIAVLSKLAHALVKISGKDVDLSELMKEVKTVLKHEVDYKREADHAIDYRKRMQGQAGYVVPEVFEEFSTKRVLALEWIEGVRFQDWMDSSPSLDDRQKVGVSLLDLYFKEFFEWGLVQTDPNFGNFLVITQPLSLAVLDFGATLSYTESFRREYQKVLRDIHFGTPDEVLESAEKFGLLDPRESKEAKDLYLQMMRVSFEPFTPKLQPFQFSDLDYSARVRDAIMKFSRVSKFSAPPKKIIFLHRKLGGIFNILKSLDIRIDLVPYWERVTRTS